MYPEQPNEPSAPYQPQPAAPAPAPQPTPEQSPVASTSPQYSVDYLNQIAAPAAPKKLSPLVLFGAIAGFLAIVIGLLILITNLTKPADFTTQARNVQARLGTLETVTDQEQSHLQQNQLSSMNSTLKTTLLSMDSGLTTILMNRGIKTSSTTTATAKKTEATYLANLTSTLNDAYLTGTLDRTYATQMAYELTILKSMLQTLKSSANNTAVNDFYSTNVSTIDTAITAFSTFTSAK